MFIDYIYVCDLLYILLNLIKFVMEILMDFENCYVGFMNDVTADKTI